MDKPNGIITYENSNIVITKDNYMKYVFIKENKTVFIYENRDNNYYQMRLRSTGFFNKNYILASTFTLRQCLHYLYSEGYKVKKIEFEEVKED